MRLARTRGDLGIVAGAAIAVGLCGVLLLLTLSGALHGLAVLAPCMCLGAAALLGALFGRVACCAQTVKGGAMLGAIVTAPVGIAGGLVIGESVAAGLGFALIFISVPVMFCAAVVALCNWLERHPRTVGLAGEPEGGGTSSPGDE